MREKVYVETTIPSYLVARPSRDLLVAAHQRITHEWWNTRQPIFELFVSEPVLEEAAAGDAILAKKRLEILSHISVLPLQRDILGIAESLVAEGPIPRRAAGDALHISIATVYGCEYLLTWNCRHIANAGIQRTLRLLVNQQGFELPIICTPEELMGEKD